MTRGSSSVSHTERGLSRGTVLAGFLITIALAAITWAAWRSDSANPTALTVSLDKKVVAAINSAHCNYRDADLCKFFAVRAVEPAYTLAATTTTASQKTTAVLKKQSGDTYYLRTDSPAPQELIVIGNTRYTKQADGSWQKQTISTNDAFTTAATVDITLPQPVTGTGGALNYRFARTEPCGNETCRKYTVANTNIELWFNVSSYQLDHVHTASAGSDTTVDYSLGSTKIAAPRPITTTPQPAVAGAATTMPKTGDD